MVPIMIGITGHRDLREEDIPNLEERVRAIFQEIRVKYKDTPIKVLSPLAEGADRLVARIALKIENVSLIVPLPMPRSEYQKDFETEESKKEFADLLTKAEDVYELPLLEGNTAENILGYGAQRNTQYACVGAYVALHSQILIALWNGKDTKETGGTAEIVRFKLEGVPEPYTIANDPLDLPDNGPVYHIFTRRAKKQVEIISDDHKPEVDCLVKKGSNDGWYVLYPPGWKEKAPKKETGIDEVKAIAKADEYYDRILRHIDRFNGDIDYLAKSSNSSIRTTLGNRLELMSQKYKKRYRQSKSILDKWVWLWTTDLRFIVNANWNGKVKESKYYALPDENKLASLPEGVKEILAYYGLSDATAQFYQAKVKTVLTTLLIVSVLAFFSFGTFDELWSMAYILALFPSLLCVAFLINWYSDRNNYDNKFSDYRALAEGLRVQFFWKIAGLNNDVTEHYHRKYKAEMAWMLQAIKNISMKANMEIRNNPVIDNTIRLGMVKDHWIDDQKGYFDRSTSERLEIADAQGRFTLRFFIIAMFLVFGIFAVKGIILGQQWSLENILNMEDVKDWQIYPILLVLIDTFIAMGAARAMYVEKKGFTEEAKQFQRMKDLFQKGSNVMIESLKKDDLKGAERLVIELGKEALTENGDWLILRRSKPMEVPLG